MMDQRRQQLIEQYEDAALSLLMDEYANEEGERLLKEFEEAKKNGDLPDMPAELDAKCRKLIDQTFAKMERKECLKRIGRSVTKAAVLVFVLLGTLSTMVMSVEAFRVPILNFFFDESERFSSVKTNNSDVAESINRGIVYRFESNMPSGFVEIQKEIKDQYSSLCYANDDNVISLSVVRSSGELIVDTENVETTTVEINGHSVVYIIKDGYQLMWVDEQEESICTLFVRGLDESTFWEFAYSIIT